MKHECADSPASYNNEAGIRSPGSGCICDVSWKGPLCLAWPPTLGQSGASHLASRKALASSPGNESSNACLPSLVTTDKVKCWHEDAENCKVMYRYKVLLLLTATCFCNLNWIKTPLFIFVSGRHSMRTSWLYNRSARITKTMLRNVSSPHGRKVVCKLPLLNAERKIKPINNRSEWLKLDKHVPSRLTSPK